MAEAILALREDHRCRAYTGKHLCIVSSTRRHVLHGVSKIGCVTMNNVDHTLIKLHWLKSCKCSNRCGDSFALSYFSDEGRDLLFCLTQHQLIGVSYIKSHRCLSGYDVDQIRMHINFANGANLVSAEPQGEIMQKLRHFSNDDDRVFA